jgi:rsbT co-antagonist protein RsbR
MELSTPVIQLWEGILVLPIVGTLDSERSRIMVEQLLRALSSSGCFIAIIDISGVPTVDTLVAQHLMKAIDASRLMGAECIVSGIRPEIANTIVSLGLDLSRVKTKSTMSRALQDAFTSLNLKVVSTQQN